MPINPLVLALLLFLLSIAPAAAADPSPAGKTGDAPRPDETALRRLSGGIRIPTVGLADYDAVDFSQCEQFLAYLEQSYPRVFATAQAERVNGYSLILRWPGRQPESLPLLFLSHYDVVPVAELADGGDGQGEVVFRPEDKPLPPMDHYTAEWNYPPFSGAVADGRIYGRGTLDMKGMLFAILEAADSLMAEGFVPETDVWFAFGHDEETGGIHGATRIAQLFAERDVRFAAVFDEGGIIAAPGALAASFRKPVALVGLGEKGFLTLRLRVHGMGGHSSMPPAKGAAALAAEIITRLTEEQMPQRIIPPVGAILDRIRDELGDALPETLPGIAVLGANPAANALTRTTTAVTMLRAGDAANVLPPYADVTVNFRILPGDTVDDVVRHVEAVCEGYQVDIEVMGKAREPSALTPGDAPGLEWMRRALASVRPDALLVPYVTIGGTDAYKYQIVSDSIFRFMPVTLTIYEQRTIHNANEYISLENYGVMIAYFRGLLEEAAGRH